MRWKIISGRTMIPTSAAGNRRNAIGSPLTWLFFEPQKNRTMRSARGSLNTFPAPANRAITTASRSTETPTTVSSCAGGTTVHSPWVTPVLNAT